MDFDILNPDAIFFETPKNKKKVLTFLKEKNFTVNNFIGDTVAFKSPAP